MQKSAFADCFLVTKLLARLATPRQRFNSCICFVNVVLSCGGNYLGVHSSIMHLITAKQWFNPTLCWDQLLRRFHAYVFAGFDGF